LVRGRAVGKLVIAKWVLVSGNTTPQLCPAGQTTTLTRRDLGPETARYLTGQFVGAAGGEATVVVRRVV